MYNNNPQQTNKSDTETGARLLWYSLTGVCVFESAAAKDALAVKVTFCGSLRFFYLHPTREHEIHHLAPLW